jgi:seryl-tRNA synthetase
MAECVAIASRALVARHHRPAQTHRNAHWEARLLDLKLIREQTDAVRANLLARGALVDLDHILRVDEERRRLISKLNDLRQQRNDLSKSVKGRAPSEEERQLGRQLKDAEPALEADVAKIEAELDALCRALPNLTRPDVPPGVSEASNQVLRAVGEPPRFDFEPLDHMALAARHDLVDFDAGAKVTGQKFYFLKNELVLLEQALIRLALDRTHARGFTLWQTPDLARRAVCIGTGFATEGPERQIYTIEDADLALIGTAEITLSGMHADEIFEPSTLPRRYTGLSHCYRVEAGAAGRVGRGLYRVHQFTKVEMFAYTTPDQSEAMHEELLSIEEEIFQALELPYRVVLLCGGDSAAQSARTYDIEAWMPGRGGEGEWGEVTSTSTCTDYQARRLNIRYRDPETRKPAFVHMLNGTAIASPRCLVSLLEVHQQHDGSIRIPEALRGYAGFDRIG